jgi:hypothetical protein
LIEIEVVVQCQFEHGSAVYIAGLRKALDALEELCPTAEGNHVQIVHGCYIA